MRTSTILSAILACAMFAGGCRAGAFLKNKDKTLEEIATYINMLHRTKDFHTIYSLFNVGTRPNSAVLRDRYTELVRRYRQLKKGEVGPLGKNVSKEEGLNLVINGYKILTTPEYSQVYEWVLNEAPPNFMEAVLRRGVARKRAKISAPGVGAWLAFLVFSLVLFDLLSTFLPYYVGKSSETRRVGKRPKKKHAAAPQERPGLRDMHISKIFSRVLRRGAQV